MLAALIFGGALAHAGCRPHQAVGPPPPTQEDTAPVSYHESDTDFALYSTLQGKMARLEELLNAIDRFLETPTLRERVVRDAREFHQLLSECRGLYPTNLPPEDRAGYDLAVGQALALSNRMRDAIGAYDTAAARKTITQMMQQRQRAHTRFSP